MTLGNLNGLDKADESWKAEEEAEDGRTRRWKKRK
jgi:hypothetical protein